MLVILVNRTFLNMQYSQHRHKPTQKRLVTQTKRTWSGSHSVTKEYVHCSIQLHIKRRSLSVTYWWLCPLFCLFPLSEFLSYMFMSLQCQEETQLNFKNIVDFNVRKEYFNCSTMKSRYWRGQGILRFSPLSKILFQRFNSCVRSRRLRLRRKVILFCFYTSLWLPL